jgi:hypothetical protein
MIECVSPLSVAPVQLIIGPGRAEKNYWRDLWRYRELFQVLAWRDVSVRMSCGRIRRRRKQGEGSPHQAFNNFIVWCLTMLFSGKEASS